MKRMTQVPVNHEGPFESPFVRRDNSRGQEIGYDLESSYGSRKGFAVRRWARIGGQTKTRYVKRYVDLVTARRVTAVLNWAVPFELDSEEAARGRVYRLMMAGGPGDGPQIYTSWRHYMGVAVMLGICAGKELANA